jgi:beta-barrel assembly-enhancing protease
VARGRGRGFHLRLLPVVLSLCVLAGLCACASGRPDISAGARVGPAAGAAAGTPGQQWDQIAQLLEDKNWPQAIAALRTFVDARSFGTLPADTQHQALSTAGSLMAQHGTLEVGYAYLVRATVMPQATFRDWLERLEAAHRLGHEDDSVACLTVIARKWPANIAKFDSDYLFRIVDESRRLKHDVRLSLLQALYQAHWKLKWAIEPSASWRDLALLLVDKGRLAEAIDVSSHVTDIYVLIAMRADRRFDAVVSAAQSQFDIDAAAEREFHWFQSASENAPQSLELQSDVLRVLFEQRRYPAMLASADAVLSAIQSTNFPTKLYEDYDEQQSLFLDLRAEALERAGRWDESVAELTAASLLSEKGRGNVSQLIDLGQLLCALGRPQDALSALGSVVTATSPYGASAMEMLRLDAAVQLANSKQAEKSLQYLRVHRADSPSDYEYALILTNQPDRAAAELIAQLRDPDARQDALLFVQSYEPAMGTPRELDLGARQRAVIARGDVQAAIRKVGRVEAYRLEPYY